MWHTRDVVLRAHLGAGGSSGALVGCLLHFISVAESKAEHWLSSKLTIYLVKFKKLKLFSRFSSVSSALFAGELCLLLEIAQN